MSCYVPECLHYDVYYGTKDKTVDNKPIKMCSSYFFKYPKNSKSAEYAGVNRYVLSKWGECSIKEGDYNLGYRIPSPDMLSKAKLLQVGIHDCHQYVFDEKSCSDCENSKHYFSLTYIYIYIFVFVGTKYTIRLFRLYQADKNMKKH